MTDLKPCPNPECRAKHPNVEAAQGNPHDQESSYWFVHCVMCGVIGPSTDIGGTEAEAIRLWNLLPRFIWRKEPPDVPGLWGFQQAGSRLTPSNRGLFQVSGKDIELSSQGPYWRDGWWLGPLPEVGDD